MSSMGRNGGGGFGNRLTTGQMPGSRAGMSTAFGGGGDSRPMTSVSGAGYQSKDLGKKFDPLGDGTKSTGVLVEKEEGGPEYVARQLEKQVHEHLEVSALASIQRDFPKCLEHAREAGKRERALCKHRENNGMADQVNLDLTFAVCFNLADAFHKNRMFEEAINAYNMIVKNKQYAHSGRMRVNLGNIYFEQGKFPQAVKLYRMALDQVSSSNSANLGLKHHILKNIGHAFVKMGQYQDAIQSYEAIVTSMANVQSVGDGSGVGGRDGGLPNPSILFHLLLCYFGMGDEPLMKRTFQKLVTSASLQGFNQEEEEEDEVLRDMRKSMEEKEDDVVETKQSDELRTELLKRQEKAHRFIVRGAKLIAPIISGDESKSGGDSKDGDGNEEGEDSGAGWEWVVNILRNEGMAIIAGEVEVEYSIHLMNNKQFDKAIQTLKVRHFSCIFILYGFHIF